MNFAQVLIKIMHDSISVHCNFSTMVVVMRLCWLFLGLTGPSLGRPQGRSVNERYGAPLAKVEDDAHETCDGYKDDGYECVPFDFCFNGEIVIDGGGLIDIRCGSLTLCCF